MPGKELKEGREKEKCEDGGTICMKVEIGKELGCYSLLPIAAIVQVKATVTSTS